MSENQLSVDPSELASAAAKLDALAARLETSLSTQTPGLKVPAAGIDEVSERAATTFNLAAEDFGNDGEAAVKELRKVAAVLRLQAKSFGRTEDDTMQTFLS